MAKKVVVALGLVLVVQGLFALCIVSALQILVPRNMPFGVVGSSPVVGQVTSTTSLQTISYPNQSAALKAVDQSKLYGAYVTGATSDKLIVVPAKSFFGQVEVEGAFLSAAEKMHRPVTVQNAKPLPQSDRTGGVVGILLLPLGIGGYLAAVLVFKAARGTAAAPWRAAILIGYAIVGALLTDLIAGPLIGAYSNSHFWPLLGCFALVTSAVVLAAAAIQGLVGQLGTILVVVLFIILGGSGAGGSGLYLLPSYWKYIGVVLPPQNAVSLMRNVLYFGGHDITTPVVVLSLYVLGGVAVIGYLGRIRPARAAAAARARGEVAEAAAPASPSASTGRRAVFVALAVCAVVECLFAFNYMDSGHEPVATKMPFGVTGTSPILTKVESSYSLKVTQYPSESAAKTAIGQAKIWGALVPAGSSNTLIVVPSISDLAPLDLATQFQGAAKSLGQPLRVQMYQPTPLAKKDPFGLVEAALMLPLLVGGYFGAVMLQRATGTAAGRWRVAILAGYAIVAGLAIDLIVCYLLEGYPSDKFWIVWPILSLIIAAVGLVAALLQKLLGAAGILLTVVVIVLFGNPSSGGANGVPYLPGFWRTIGPYLPPRNAYILLHRTIYFNGHGTTQALIALLLYAVLAAAILGFLDWFRSPEIPVPEEAEADVAATTIPVGAAP